MPKEGGGGRGEEREGGRELVLVGLEIIASHFSRGEAGKVENRVYMV